MELKKDKKTLQKRCNLVPSRSGLAIFAQFTAE